MLQNGLRDLLMQAPFQNPAMPIELAVERRAVECQQGATGQLLGDLQTRDQAIGDTGTGQGDEGLGGADGMAGIMYRIFSYNQLK